MSDNPLGENIPNPTEYNPGILYPIPRWAARSLLDIDKKIPMHGLDQWHAYELSWLDPSGKPMVAMAEFLFNSDSENIVESKSLKLYLNSFNQEVIESQQKLQEIITTDLSALSKSTVAVALLSATHRHGDGAGLRRGKSLDGLQLTQVKYQPEPALLTLCDDAVFDEQLYSDLFKSNCPVTGQPDWASVEIQYTGQKIEEASLLTYIVSFREHQGYHEECGERMFRDIMQHCKPTELSIALNFLRRGGLDINVYRSSEPMSSEVVKPRFVRQ